MAERSTVSRARLTEKQPVDSDEYLSSDDDNLSESDFNILNTDYGMQHGLTFSPRSPHPIHQYPHNHPTQGSFHTEQQHTPADNLNTYSERHSQDEEGWPARAYSPRKGSFRYPHGTFPLHPSHDYASEHNAQYAYQYAQPRRRPLIDFIKNEWQHTTATSASSHSSFDHLETPSCCQVVFAPRFQRSFFACLLLAFLVWGNWKTWAAQRFDEEYNIRQSTKDKVQHPEGWFGQNTRPEFFDMQQMLTLDEYLVPGLNGNRPGERRLIAVGDVHGCNEELSQLLQEAQYNAATDHLIFTGDMVSKGPSSASVVDIAMKANASCVRGNHEDRLLLTQRDLASHPSVAQKAKARDPAPSPGVPEDATIPDISKDEIVLDIDDTHDSSHEAFSRLDITDRILASQLNQKHIEYLGTCPVVLDVGQVPGMGELHIVHAGLVPGVSLENQDPISTMSMRTIDLATHVPKAKGNGVPWYRIWNKYQTFLSPEDRASVIYGHDSRRGLRLEKYSKGIDSGCVKGGQLTGLIIDGNAKGEVQVVSVDCKDYRNLERDLIRKHGRKDAPEEDSLEDAEVDDEVAMEDVPVRGKVRANRAG